MRTPNNPPVKSSPRASFSDWKFMTTIRVIDLETTGIESDSKVIEFGWCDYEVETKAISDPQSRLFYVDFIPPESRAVHHIRAADIPDSSTPFDVLADVKMPADQMAITYFAAHNASFEAKFLPDLGGYMLCTWKASLRAWPDAPSHSNGAHRYWLEDQGKIALDWNKAQPAHRAGPDAYVTAHILKALFDHGITGREMVGWTREPPILPTCPIGKLWSGKKWSEVDAGFLNWMVNHPTMEEDNKWNARRELQRRQEVSNG